MKKRIILISITIAILFLVGISYLLFFRTLPNNMIIKSPIFLNNATIPSKYTCDGDNINPPFEIKNIPKGTKSLVLIVDDPDAAGGTWTHWTLWNIDPGTSEIQENSIPSGASAGKTSYGRSKYDGPCPPSGTHHYFFRLYALNTDLNLSSNTDRPSLEKTISSHILDKAEMVGLYSHK